MAQTKLNYNKNVSSTTAEPNNLNPSDTATFVRLIHNKQAIKLNPTCVRSKLLSHPVFAAGTRYTGPGPGATLILNVAPGGSAMFYVVSSSALIRRY